MGVKRSLSRWVRGRNRERMGIVIDKRKGIGRREKERRTRKEGRKKVEEEEADLA